MMETNVIHLGDCVEGLKTLPDECVDVVVSDPPYLLTQRGCSGNSGGMMQKELNKKGKVFEFNSVNIEDYLHELYRVLKDGTHCYLMCNHVNLTHFLKVIDDSKFHFIKCLIWQKGNVILGTKYMNAFEYILFMSKGKNRNVNDCGIPDILSVPNIKTKDIGGVISMIARNLSGLWRYLSLKVQTGKTSYLTHSWVLALRHSPVSTRTENSSDGR